METKITTEIKNLWGVPLKEDNEHTDSPDIPVLDNLDFDNSVSSKQDLCSLDSISCEGKGLVTPNTSQESSLHSDLSKDTLCLCGHKKKYHNYDFTTECLKCSGGQCEKFRKVK